MTEETNCYECDTPLVSVCPQCNPYLSAASSPAGDEDEVERVARSLLRDEIESYRESDVLLDEHIQWWRDGKGNPESCVHYSTIGKAMRRASAAISAMRPAPKLTEEWTKDHQTSLVAAVYDAMWHWDEVPMDVDDSISLAEMLKDKLRENGLTLSLIDKLTEAG